MFKSLAVFAVSFIVFVISSLLGAFLLMLVVGGGEGNLNWSYSESLGVAIGIYLVRWAYSLYEAFSKGLREGLDKNRRI